MILPRKWIILRPGFLIPVFFLSFCQLSGQIHWLDAESLALGRCYSSCKGTASPGINQAGLGWIDQNSCSLHHLQPFLTTGLGMTALTAQLSMKRGGLGIRTSTMGITGMRQSSSWISYGLTLHSRIAAGVGILVRHTGVSEEPVSHLEAGFALGLQFRIENNLILGAHITHPAAWQNHQPLVDNNLLMITSGLSYSFFKTTHYFTEFQLSAGKPVRWCHGLAVKLTDSMRMLAGMHNHPWSFSAGVSLEYRSWFIVLSGAYCLDTGTTPSTSLSYVW